MLPKYVSHKTVKAVKIAEIQLHDNGGNATIIPEYDVKPFCVSEAYMQKHDPQVGGYFVQYEDGYQSFSPAKAFEGGYTKLEKVVEEESSVEQMIVDKGLTAPRVTPQDIENNIASVHYFSARQGARAALYERGETTQLDDKADNALVLLTFCVLVLKNGFTVTGESACASPENFDAEIGRKIARENAINKLWPLMGYHLKQKLSEQ